ncbi:MAG: M12 family metallo-peptidase [Planctomycetota bacterium]|nr:M12 family metallo-peptidase [Planctomycetota bacterium]
MRSIVLMAVVGVCASLASAQVQSPDGAFTMLKDVPQDVIGGPANVRPDVFQPVRVEWPALRASLGAAPLENTVGGGEPIVVSLPRPDGGWMRFSVVESPVMEPGLAAALPDVKTFLGQGLDDPASTVRFDYTPHGFHAQVFTGEGSFYIDPVTMGETEHVASYWKRDLRRPIGGWACTVIDDGAPAPEPRYEERAIVNLKTYRLAIATTGEYTAFHGGTAALGQAAVVTAVNRMNQIYERDLAVRFTLVANNINLIFTNAATDPYANNGSGADLTANQTQCNNIIGTANYDVGHLFQTGNGGVAQLSSVCGTGKARGLSGLPSPVNDPFVIDYVCHEVGHQFAGRHCFNNCDGGPGDDQSFAYEPGSGATIMAYAGICGPTNLQNNSDAMFHSGSIALMSAFVSGTSCGSSVSTGNNTPIVDAGPNYSIPANTPFVLTATGSDPDGDAVTYSWEQRNTGATVAVNVDNGSSPIQRTWLPTTSPARTIPRLSNLLANTVAFGEILPTTTRSLSYRVVARDNRAGGGGIATDDMTVSVTDTGQAFAVTSPNTNVAWSGTRTVTWNVAGTTGAPISCANVRILLSTNGGNTWTTVLAESTPNDGSHIVTLPNITTGTARIRVEGVGNIFFDISNTNFSISPATGVALNGTGVDTFTDTAGNGNANGVIDSGESAIGVSVQVLNGGAQTATGVAGTLTSLTPTVTIVSGVSAYVNLAPGAPATNLTPYVINVSPSHPCGDPINLRLSIASAQGSGTYNFSFATGTLPPPVSQTFTWSGPALAIPDNNTTGVSAPLNVSGMTGTLSDVNFRINGTSCSAAQGSTTVGLTHSWVGDLVLALRAPGGAPTVIVVDRPGVPASQFGNDGNNFCQSIFDDEASNPIENAANTLAPFTGSWTPNGALSAFDGLSPNGEWRLDVSDRASGDTGTLRNWSLILSTQAPRTCQPPNNAPPCDPDFNADGNVDQDDIACLAQVVAGDPGCSSNDPDFNGDGNVDQDDIAALEQVVGGAPCP